MILSDARAYLWFYAMGLPLQSLLAVLSAVLRCSGDTRTPLLFNAGTNLLNVCLNYVLIFPSRQVVILGRSLSIWGVGLGVTGAAIGTALSGGLMGISMALFMALRKGPLQMTAVVLFRPQKSVVRRALALGIPVFLERACFSCGQLIVTHMVAGLGNIALAANHVAVTAEAISYLPAQGVSFAATASVGQAIGGNQPVLARRYGVLSGRIGWDIPVFLRRALGRNLLLRPRGDCSGCRYAAHCCHFGTSVRPFYCSGRCASRGWGQPHAVSDCADGGVGSPASAWSHTPRSVRFGSCCHLGCHGCGSYAARCPVPIFCLQNQMDSTCGPDIGKTDRQELIALLVYCNL